MSKFDVMDPRMLVGSNFLSPKVNHSLNFESKSN
jgi:hypothetical protein